MNTEIHTPLAPTPLSSFAQGARSGPFLQVSGCGSLDPGTGQVINLGDVGAQVTATLETVRAILEAGGASFADVLMVRVYLTDRAHFPLMNAAYESFIAEHAPTAKPARTTLMVGLPLEGMLVEIDALAVVA